MRVCVSVCVCVCVRVGIRVIDSQAKITPHIIEQRWQLLIKYFVSWYPFLEV